MPEAATRRRQSWAWNSGCLAPDSRLFTLNGPVPCKMVQLLEPSPLGCCEVRSSHDMSGRCGRAECCCYRWRVLSLAGVQPSQRILDLGVRLRGVGLRLVPERQPLGLHSRALSAWQKGCAHNAHLSRLRFCILCTHRRGWRAAGPAPARPAGAAGS